MTETGPEDPQPERDRLTEEEFRAALGEIPDAEPVPDEDRVVDDPDDELRAATALDVPGLDPTDALGPS